MGKRGSTPHVPLEDVLEVFAERDDPAEPLTASEIADILGCSRRTALDKLHELADRGDITSKKVGSRSRVWWLPAQDGKDDHEIDSDDPLFSAPTFTVDEPVDEEDIDDVLYGEIEG